MTNMDQEYFKVQIKKIFMLRFCGAKYFLFNTLKHMTGKLIFNYIYGITCVFILDIWNTSFLKTLLLSPDSNTTQVQVFSFCFFLWLSVVNPHDIECPASHKQ